VNYCDLTFPTPEENLACDEALLDLAEAGDANATLRIWEPIRYFVVLGYGNRLSTEVNSGFCRQNTIPILRRCTGGGTVLQGPGLLNYSLILPIESSGPSHSVTAANRFIMEQHRHALAHVLHAPVEISGHTDLTIGGLKFSGNAQRRRKRFLLFHGAFLLHFDIGLIEKALPMPSAEPDYRMGRPHSEFLMNLKIHRDLLKRALTESWKTASTLGRIPYDRIDSLVREKYSKEEWTCKF
jgi:lipoate-protein ligase A